MPISVISSISSKVGDRRKEIVAPITVGGSLLFSGDSNSNLSIPNDVDLRMGTGDFTIEWFQKMLPLGQSFPRVFSIGNFNTQSIAVSIEGNDTTRTFYAWISSANSIVSGNFNNTWYHFAICRSGTTLRVFRDGVQVGSNITNSTNFNNTTSVLRIGNESTLVAAASFKGYITNFRWTKGVARYTANFVKPSSPLTSDGNTKLLILASSDATKDTDSSGSGKVITNNNVVWSSDTPFS